MAETYSGPLTVELLEKGDREIARIIAGLPDDAELIATPMMDALVYQFKDYDRVIAICERAIPSVLAFPLRIAKLKIAMVNAERRKPTPNMERVDAWMNRTDDILDQSGGLDAPGVRRTMVLFHYNGALVCRVVGDFQGEAEHHRQIALIADDRFSLDNAGYMAEVAMMFHHAKEGTATDELWEHFLDAGDAYRDTLDSNIPREAQWIANDCGHRVQLAILLGYMGEDYEYWLDEGFDELVRLLSIGVPQSSVYTADLIIAMTLFEHDQDAMACWMAERIIADEDAGNDWRMLAALLKARITEKEDDFRAVIAMPGNGICHAARAVAERVLTP